MENLSDLLYSSMQSIVSLNALVTQLTEKISELTISFADTKADVKKAKEDIDDLKNRDTAKITQVQVVSGENGVGDESCAKVCAGSTGRTTTNWINFGTYGVYTDVDISECGFVKIPTITTALEGLLPGYHWLSTGPAAIYEATTTTFRVYIRNTDWNPKNGKATSTGWNIEWIAAGFTC